MQARIGAYPRGHTSCSALALDLPVLGAARTAAARARACTEAAQLTREAPDLHHLAQVAALGPPTTWSNTANPVTIRELGCERKSLHTNTAGCDELVPAHSKSPGVVITRICSRRRASP